MPKNQKSKKKKIFNISFGKIPQIEIIFSIQNMAVMLKSGLSLQDTLEILSTQVQSKRLKETYINVLADINEGLTFTNSLQKYPKVFSNLIVSITNAGEQSGTLEKNLAYLADYMKKDYVLMKKIKAAMFYPIVILGLTFVELNGVIFFILPQLDSFFSSFKTDSVLTHIVLGIGRFARGNALYIGVGFVIFVISLILYLRTPAGKITKDLLSLRVPIVKKLNKEIILSNFSRTLGILLQSGIPVYDALVISSQSISNIFYHNAIESLKSSVLSGNDVSASMANFPKYFPAIFVKMIEAGEKSGSLEGNLMAMHDYYADEADDMSNNLATIIEPILLIFVGIVVGILAVSVVVPLYQVVSSIHA